MRYLPLFKEKINCENPGEVFEYLMSELKITITKWDYFVNWTKVNNGLKKFEITLNLLNYLIGKDNIEDEAIKLIEEHPQIIQAIPILLACRNDNMLLLKEYQSGKFIYEDYNFGKKSQITPTKAVEFLSRSGFLEQLQSKRILSLVDYVFGVETGLDSNGRKNRGGAAMEDIVEFFVKDICEKNNYEYITQATAPRIKKKWNKHLTVDKSTRRIDFAINTPDKLILIETNFYGGGGSKLKSTAGEYKSLYRSIKSDNHQFIWITDGAGWKTTQKPLEETFNEIDFILNLKMIERGLLDEIIIS